MPVLRQCLAIAVGLPALVDASAGAAGSEPSSALRVELEWEWDSSLGFDTVDLDLHLHQPASIAPWGGSGGNPDDCAADNCGVSSYAFPNAQAPDWFDGVAPPDPVDWYLSPVFEENSCYLLPGGRGAEWQAIGLGCHNPRLSLDNTSCDPDETDIDDFLYCHPEAANIDFMPLNQWTRVGVHYFSSQGQTYSVHPKVRFFCGQELIVELGDAGVGGYSEEVTFAPSGGGTLFWLVADVIFIEHPQTGETLCQVQPLYGSGQMPLYTTASTVQLSFGPPYPDVPAPIFWDGFETGDTSSWSLVVP